MDAESLEVLVVNAKGGDKTALNLILESDSLRRAASVHGRGLPEQYQEDILQEMRIRVYLGLSTFKGRSSFTSWLYRIARNGTVEFIRKSKHSLGKGQMVNTNELDTLEDHPYLSAMPDVNPDSKFRELELYTAVDSVLRHIGKVKQFHWISLRNHYFHGLTIDEESMISGEDYSALKARRLRARQYFLGRLMVHHTIKEYFRNPSGKLDVPSICNSFFNFYMEFQERSGIKNSYYYPQPK